jgi:hypothetical protein
MWLAQARGANRTPETSPIVWGCLLVGEALAPEVSGVALDKLLLTMFLYCTVALLLATNTIDHGHRMRFQKAIG